MKQFTKEHSLAVKGFAILLLLMYHLFENEYLVTNLSVNHSPIPLDTFLLISGFGNICVAVFVFLTAFGITTGLLKQPEITMKEAYRQASRRFVILMLQFACLYVSVNLLWGYKFDYASLYGEGKQGILYAITDALGLSMFFDSPTLTMTWWYMELAYLLIFLVPVLTWLVKKIGYPILLLAFFAPAAVQFVPDMERYFFTAVLGVCAAYGKLPDKLLNLKIKSWLQWIVGILGFVACILVRQNYVVQLSYIHLADAVIALFLVYFAGVLLFKIPGINKVLVFLGKYSMNIYLVHSFFYMLLWQKFIYSFQYAWAIFLALLITSLLYAVCLELVKKALGFRKLLQKIPF